MAIESKKTILLKAVLQIMAIIDLGILLTIFGVYIIILDNDWDYAVTFVIAGDWPRARSRVLGGIFSGDRG